MPPKAARVFEEILHVRGLRDVRLHDDGLSACGFEFRH
jgi:hypothetical protein